MMELEDLATPQYCDETTVLFAEGQEPGSILFLLERTAEFTMNSSSGKRLMLGLAAPGELLGTC